MKIRILASILITVVLCMQGTAQSYNIGWHKVAGGGGASAGGAFSVNGTIGQPDAGAVMSAGSYSVTGGFWSIISVAQTPGLPILAITHSGDSVTVFWLNTGSYTLQQNSNLATADWTISGYPITTANGTKSITITPATGNLFFRLANP